jgi:hypothetical protein
MFKIGDTIKTGNYIGIIKAIGNTPGRNYDNNPYRVWSNWDRDIDKNFPKHWSYIDMENKSYIILKTKTVNLPNWF